MRMGGKVPGLVPDFLDKLRPNPARPESVPKYIDPLPVPPVLQPLRRRHGVACYRVAMRQVLQQLHSRFPLTLVWGYDGMYPGPTLIARSGEPVTVEWVNHLPTRHLLPIDTTLRGAADTPPVRTVVHLHGGRVPPEADGHPEAWFAPFGTETGPTYETNEYDYPNTQAAATLWYHDQALGSMRLNVYAGLAGFYLLRDEVEDRLRLPVGRYEVPLIIQDRSFNPDGSLRYPGQPAPSAVPGCFGNTVLVNGKVWPYLLVEPRRYRLRLLNGANARFYRLRLSSGQPFIQIGTDQGLLPAPVPVDTLLLAPGERADVIVDFGGRFGQEILLTNDAPAPFPNGVPADPCTTGQVMQFRVLMPPFGPDTSEVPDELDPAAALAADAAIASRDLTLVEGEDRFRRPRLLLTARGWGDPITELPRLGSREIWNLVNLTSDAQPIHLHQVRFHVLERQPFTATQLNATGFIHLTDPAPPPPPHERGGKDTVVAPPGEITRIIAEFGPFAGEYPWQCQILEHADHEMMRPYRVITDPDEDYGDAVGDVGHVGDVGDKDDNDGEDIA